MRKPQAWLSKLLVPWRSKSSKVQIKKYQTFIVTDIKVGFNSLFGFRISIWLGGGWAIITQRNIYSSICNRPHSALLQTLHNTSVSSSLYSAKYLGQLFCRTKNNTISSPNFIHSHLRPYHDEYTRSRLITEVKHHRARIVLGWGTAWEHLVP